MFSIDVQLLTGRYVATDVGDRQKAEWPPHPSRLFSAFVDAAASDPDAPSAWRAALEWLEGQPAPSVAGPDCSRRDVVPVFVPVNDTSVHRELFDKEAAVEEATSPKTKDAAKKKFDEALRKEVLPTEKLSADAIRAAGRVLPEGRSKQPRTFPSVTPAVSEISEIPVVSYVWPDEPAAETKSALDEIAAAVVRLGHSSSFVSVRVGDNAQARWVPDNKANDLVLRIPRMGQLKRLEEEFIRTGASQARVMPTGHQRYRDLHNQTHQEEPVQSVWGQDWIVFARRQVKSGERSTKFPIVRAADVAGSLRATLMKSGDQPAPSVLTGHTDTDLPAATPHIAYVALPSVGFPHADGGILGVALVFPRTMDEAQRRAVHRAVLGWKGSVEHGEDAQITRLTLGGSGSVAVERLLDPADASWTLQPNRWCSPSRSWRSVTPVALDRNPGALSDEQAREAARETIRRACVHIGLPAPRHVEISLMPLVSATSPVRDHGPYPRRRPGAAASRFQRVCVHAELIFDEPVAGPMLLGAGRHLGMGLFIPTDEVAP